MTGVSWSPPFRASRVGGGVTASFADGDVELLRELVQQLLTLLREGEEHPGREADPLEAAVGIGSATAPPEDPALARLLPDAYRDDPEAAAEFRRYTETGLRDRKRAAARAVLRSLEGGGKTITADREQAFAWLTALNDVRLALGTRLDVTEDWDELVEELDDDDPRLLGFEVYDFLTGMQELLVRALD